MRGLLAFITGSGLAWGAQQIDQEARELFQRTEYKQSLNVLLKKPNKDAPALQLIGQDYFMLGEYKKSTEALEKASSLDPENPQILLWLGRAYGRRAETASFLTAPGYASKARQNLEKSVHLDPSNKEATGDLLDFYLEAPGFLGGGFQKAESLAGVIEKADAAEGHYARAVIDQRRKDYSDAERQLRRAIELAPREASRFVALAKYLGERGQINESDELFAQAERLAPNDPHIEFDRAAAYVEQNRNLEQARALLQKYLQAPLTPEDPPREKAEALLRKIT